jgi:hypothetical protein
MDPKRLLRKGPGSLVKNKHELSARKGRGCLKNRARGHVEAWNKGVFLTFVLCGGFAACKRVFSLPYDYTLSPVNTRLY